jgi:LuxR family maltose regulon positive regulatory protein
MSTATAPHALRTDLPPRGRPVALRLAAEPPPTDLAGRRRLLQPLLAGNERLAVIVAPAGYGKTRLVSDWEAQDPRRFAWVRLTPGDDAPESLLRAIATAVAPRRTPEPSVEAVASALAGGDPVVLVLDDLQVLRSAGARDTVAAVAARIPDGSRLALVSRTEPALALGRLRASDDVLELRRDELAMTEAETVEALDGAAPRERDRMLALTEGWPAAVRLLTRVLRDGGALDTLGGDDAVMAGYLHEEVFAAIAPEDLEFLRRVSVLDVMSGPLCDAVVRGSGSALRLRALEAAGALVLALDRARTSFRLHPLAAQALRTDLRCLEAELEPELHRRASAWYADRGDVDRAVDHAVSAHDLDAVDALVASRAAPYVASGRAPVMAAWLARLPDEEIAARPGLALSASACGLAAGDRDGAERWLQAARAASADGPAAAALRAAVARTGLDQATRDAELAYAAAPGSGPAHALACLLLGACRLLDGQADAAHATLDEGALAAGPVAPLAGALCRALQALAAADDADAVLLAGSARAALGASPELRDAPLAALVHAVSAAALAHTGAFETARDDLERALRLLDGMPAAVPWYGACVELAVARAQLRLSDGSSAQEHLRRATRRLREMPDAAALRAWVDDGWARADDFAAGEATAPAVLTPAELRVLRFLPTHLAFREIAVRLHISVNTVKTHAHAVYRKLDASSRSQAVDRARRIGLVDP